MSAPVCPISRSQAVSGQPGLRLPSMLRPTDLPSAIAAANQAAQILAGRRVINNFYPPRTIPSPGSDGPNQHGGRPKHSRWKEVSRTTKKMKFYNPEDEEIWIEVERITKIVWEDPGYGTRLTFEYGE